MLIHKKGARETGWNKQKKVGGGPRLMRRRAKCIREGQAWDRKKKVKPACFGAYVKTRFGKTGLVKNIKAKGPGHV
jgi:hypothetical protein